MSAGIFLDLASNAVTLALNTYGTAISSTAALTGVDCVDVVGNMMTAFMTVSAIGSSGNVTVKIQESSDDSTYTDISGATFTAASTVNTKQIISFQCKSRYARAYATLNSGTSVTMQITLLGQRRTTPSGNGGWVNEAGAS